MRPFVIGNLNNPPLNNINSSLVNLDNSHAGGIAFANTTIPYGQHTFAPAGSNIQGAGSIYPCAQNGGKNNRKKINKISRKYKMKGSKRRVRKTKGRVRSRYSRRNITAKRVSKSRLRKRGMAGGAFQSPMTTPNYTAGYSQYQNNNGSLSNTYSTGGHLPASLSALANPAPYQNVAGDVDNLNHNTLNSYGNIGAGSGFASRGWF